MRGTRMVGGGHITPPWDHPRVCGEHRFSTCLVSCRPGSSPRMRGTLDIGRHESGHAGIIPAYAGNTDDWHGNAYEARDHPRVCGEHIKYAVEGATSQGSSPRMRGTPTQTVEILFLSGIIPAYAGNTIHTKCMATPRRDHPRVRGEHTVAVAVVARVWGSSPRMRGTHQIFRHVRGKIGIIPAYAGNTKKTELFGHSVGDHPRVCGEHQNATSP